MSKNNFVWAHDKDANVREPIRELSQKGWQRRDIPKASNINWIFKQIGDEFSAQREEMNKILVEMEKQKAELAQEIINNLDKISNLKRDVAIARRTQTMLHKDFYEVQEAFFHVASVLEQTIGAVNDRRESPFYAKFPFRYKAGGKPKPIRDIRLESVPQTGTKE